MTAAFCDTSVLIRYFAEDDIARAAAAALIDSDTRVVLSTAVIVETVHVLRRLYGFADQRIASLLLRFLSRTNVEVADADKAGVIAAITSIRGSSRRVPDALIVMAAQQSRVDFIATLDEKLTSPLLQVRML